MSHCPTCCTRFDACSECHEKDFAQWDFAIQRLALENDKLKAAQEQWAKEELLAQQGKRENFRTMYCDNCENYQSDKCSRCFSYGYTYPVNFTPAKHFLFKEPHPKDVEIARLREQVEKMKCCTNCKHDKDFECDGCVEGYTKWEAK